jgi:hypothetical protein
MDYEFTTAPMYDGTSRRVRAVEIFNTVTGKTVWVSRAQPWESKVAHVARAFADAEALAA